MGPATVHRFAHTVEYVLFKPSYFGRGIICNMNGIQDDHPVDAGAPFPEAGVMEPVGGIGKQYGYDIGARFQRYLKSAVIERDERGIGLIEGAFGENEDIFALPDDLFEVHDAFSFTGGIAAVHEYGHLPVQVAEKGHPGQLVFGKRAAHDGDGPEYQGYIQVGLVVGYDNVPAALLKDARRGIGYAGTHACHAQPDNAPASYDMPYGLSPAGKPENKEERKEQQEQQYEGEGAVQGINKTHKAYR